MTVTRDMSVNACERNKEWFGGGEFVVWLEGHESDWGLVDR